MPTIQDLGSRERLSAQRKLSDTLPQLEARLQAKAKVRLWDMFQSGVSAHCIKVVISVSPALRALGVTWELLPEACACSHATDAGCPWHLRWMLNPDLVGHAQTLEKAAETVRSERDIRLAKSSQSQYAPK